MEVSCKRTFLILLLSFSYIIANAQTFISGKVKTETNAPADAATVALLCVKDSAFVKSTTCNKDGYFYFKGIKADEYILLVTKIGYKKSINGPYQVLANKSIIVDPILLQLSENKLNEVIVIDKRKYIDVRPDKTILNVDKSILATGAPIMDILRTAPGVKTNSSGDIFLRGRQAALIFINGKKIELSGADLVAYLQSIQSAEIEQIELIQNPPSKYEASGGGGVINIILKKGKNVGFNGSFTAADGMGKYDYATTGFTGNYRAEKINIFGGLSYNYDKKSHTINTFRTLDNAEKTTFNMHYYSTQRAPEADYRLGADYLIDSAHTIGFVLRGANSSNYIHKQTNTPMFQNGVADSTFNIFSDLKRKISSINYNANYTGTIGHTAQTLSADADYSVFNRRVNEDLLSTVVSNQNQTIVPQALFNNNILKNTAPTRYVIESFKLDYANPITKTSRLEAGAKYCFVKSDNYQYFDVLQNGTYQAYSDFTNQFFYREKTSSAYINYIGLWSKLHYSLGLRAEKIVSDANTVSINRNVKRSYTNLFPSVELTYPVTNASLAFNYNRRIDPPGYPDLNPIISFQDNYNYRMGNAYLTPAYTNHAQFTYTSNSDWSVNLFAEHTSNLWHYTYYAQDEATGVLITTRRNLKTVKTIGMRLDVPIKLTNWWNIDFNSELSYSKYIDSTISLSKGSKYISLYLDQSFKLFKGMSATIQGNYESPTFFGITSFRPNYYANAAISQSLMHSAASLTLSCRDIFNTIRDRAVTYVNNLNLNVYDKSASQQIRLTFSYRFGKKTVKGARRHTNGIDQEQKRLGGGD